MLSRKGTVFLNNGKPFFYLADTCWSAFTNITMDEWNYYLDYRSSQGFNVIQINVLSQWDASGSDLNIYPFPITKNGHQYSYDYSKLNDAYFDRAEKMLQAVVDRGMIPALVLLWSNYVPDTWAANMAINNQFPYEQLDNYISYVTERFKKFHPIYFVSGDTDFPTEETIRYYDKVFKVAKQHDPSAMYSFHIKGRLAEIPEQFLNKIDFFSYQSGHNLAGQATAYTIPIQLRKQGFDRPIINTEPCYEQISYSRNLYGRYTARDVRKASWSAVLSGANAGITYGAHGIWSWHRTGYSFGIVEGEGFDSPFDWRDALHFDGANDIAYLKKIITSYFPAGISPVNVKLKNEDSIRIGINSKKDRYAIFLPTNTKLDISDLGLSSDDVTATSFDLATRSRHPLLFEDKTHIGLSKSQADSIIILNKGE